MPQDLGQSPLLLDIAGTHLDASDRRRLQHPLTGGLVLFARNWVDRAQLTALTTEVKAIRPDLLICVDHEGGRVQRFRSDGFTHLPAMAVLGDLWMADAMAATNAATAAGYVLGAELRACGVDLSFTPVLDLAHGGSTVIGNRAFHRDARVVSLLAKSLMHGLLQAGMANCGKHFPGHGFVAADSHVAVPVDQRSLKTILADDAKPYDWLSTSLTSVMPAHVIYPKVDAAPAGFSARWLQSSATTSAWPAPKWPAACWPARWLRWARVATWCCCATSRWSRVAQRWMHCSKAWPVPPTKAGGDPMATARRAGCPCCP